MKKEHEGGLELVICASVREFEHVKVTNNDPEVDVGAGFRRK